MEEPEHESAGGTAADTEEDRPKRSRARAAALVSARSLLALLSVAVLVAIAIGWTATDRLTGQMSTSKVLAEPVPVPHVPRVRDTATDILLVGSDSRTDAQGDPLPLHVLKELRTESTNGINTDTLILVRVPEGGEPTAVSIPRDTSVAVPGEPPEKINAMYGLAKSRAVDRLESEGVTDSARIEREASLAGQRALVRGVQALTGARVDHYAEVNLLGFYEFTEAIGGVEVCLRRATNDKDSGAAFEAGPQRISGGDALAFVRQRHGLPRGDLDRIVRQQAFMAALANEVLSSGTLTDPAKLRELTGAATRAVVLDEDWDVAGFAQQMQGLASGGVEFVTIPITSTTERNERGQSIVTVDPRQVHEFVAGLGTAPPSTGDLGPEPLLRLDGSAEARPAEAPINSTGVPCVN